MGDITHSEFCARGGRAKTAAKLEAVRRNLAKAKAVLTAKRRAQNAQKKRDAE